MRASHLRLLAAVALCVSGLSCASRPLPKFEKPLARTRFQTVRTTAYTHTEADHKPYACNSAMGTPLCCGLINSAAADWSRWPAGSVFRIQETNELFRVDDYGWALAGTNTIDLYRPTRSAMNSWGVRRCNIEILEWGDTKRSYAILKPRARYAHIKRMLRQIEAQKPDRMPEAGPPPEVVATVPPPSLSPVPVPANQVPPRAEFVSTITSATGNPVEAPSTQPELQGNSVRKPFYR